MKFQNVLIPISAQRSVRCGHFSVTIRRVRHGPCVRTLMPEHWEIQEVAYWLKSKKLLWNCDVISWTNREKSNPLKFHNYIIIYACWRIFLWTNLYNMRSRLPYIAISLCQVHIKIRYICKYMYGNVWIRYYLESDQTSGNVSYPV